MFEIPFVFVDIETNGGNGERGRIIEIAAIKVLDGQIVDAFESLVNPGTSIPSWITALTDIQPKDLVGVPYFEDIADQLYQFVDGCVFAAHNVLFDYSFVKREFAAAGYRYSPKLFCTVKMSRALYPEHRGHSLEKIIQRHRIATSNRHRAHDDALATVEYAQLALKQKGSEALERNIALQLKTKTLPPHVEEAVILSLPETSGVYIFEDDSGMPLYVGKSVNIRARVRSHFVNATSVAKEMKMALQSHHVSYIQTETELEALLLESVKVKELQPLFNRKLRRAKTQHILVKTQTPDGYTSIQVESHDLSRYAALADVYGVYTSKNQAKQALESAARAYQLCPKLLGLEKSKGECFRRQLGLCRGACIGLEAPDSYNPRVETALERSKIESWPYRGAIVAPISQTRSIVIDQWVPVQIIDHEHDVTTEIDGTFDLDTYKILRAHIRKIRSNVALWQAIE